MRRRVLAAMALVAVVVGGGLAARLPTPWLLVEPGRVEPVKAWLQADGQERTGGPFWMLTVAARPARVADLAAVLGDPQKTLWPRTVLGPGPSAQVERRQLAALRASQQAALAAVAHWRGLSQLPPLVWETPPQVGGPSGGLAFALAAVDALAPGSLTGGCRVGATGTVTSAGTVGPVAGLPQKTAAARQAGIAILFRPAQRGPDERGPSAASEAPPPGGAVPSSGRTRGPLCASPGIGSGGGAGSLRVVPVAHLAEAIDWLCGQRVDDALCAP